jgi:hypothetical protein
LIHFRVLWKIFFGGEALSVTVVSSPLTSQVLLGAEKVLRIFRFSGVLESFEGVAEGFQVLGDAGSFSEFPQRRGHARRTFRSFPRPPKTPASLGRILESFKGLVFFG